MDLTCEQLVDLLLDFHAGEVADEVREAVRVHVCGCPPCGVKVTTYRLTVRVVGCLPKAVPLSPAFEQRLRLALGEQRD